MKQRVSLKVTIRRDLKKGAGGTVRGFVLSFGLGLMDQGVVVKRFANSYHDHCPDFKINKEQGQMVAKFLQDHDNAKFFNVNWSADYDQKFVAQICDAKSHIRVARYIKQNAILGMPVAFEQGANSRLLTIMCNFTICTGTFPALIVLTDLITTDKAVAWVLAEIIYPTHLAV